MKTYLFLLVILISVMTAWCQTSIGIKAKNNEKGEEKEADIFQMDKPGVLTFTKGTEIVARIEKPQVEIIMEKEKPKLLQANTKPPFIEIIEKPLDINTFYLITEPVK